MPKVTNPDEVKSNRDLPETPQSPEQETISRLLEANATLLNQYNVVIDKLNRLESIQNQGKLRKYDEIHDPESQKKTGRIPSFDGKNPIVKLERTGKSWLDESNTIHDEQAIKAYVLGEEKPRVFSLLEFNAAASGNSIQCIVNDWDVLMDKQQKLSKKRHEFQRMSGRTAKVNTVELLKEIREMENSITINVTLSEDMGKTFGGVTLDIPWQHVFNAVS